MAGPFDLKVIEDTYLPPNFICLDSGESIAFLNTDNGYVVNVPKAPVFELGVNLPREFKQDGDRITGMFDVWFRFRC